MNQQVSEARFVLAVCTETYRRRASGQEKPGTGLGAIHESRLIQQLRYNAGGKFVPVVFTEEDRAHIPIALQGDTHYTLSGNGYEELYRLLTDQPKVKKPDLGRLHPLPLIQARADFRNALWNVPGRVQDRQDRQDRPVPLTHVR